MDHLEQIRIRIRRILGPEGTACETHTVHCPIHHQSKLLLECETCDRCIELTPEKPFVVCAIPPDTVKPDTLVRIARRFVDRLTSVLTIGELMTREVLCVTPDFGLESVRALLLEHHISGVPVVDEEGFPLGIVSKTDLVRRPQGSATAGEVMAPVAFTLEEDQPLASAIKLMLTEKVHRVPVVDHAGRVTGVLSTMDVLRWLDS